MNAIKRYKYVDIIRNMRLIPKNYSIRFQVVLITKKCSDFVLYIYFLDTFLFDIQKLAYFQKGLMEKSRGRIHTFPEGLCILLLES